MALRLTKQRQKRRERRVCCVGLPGSPSIGSRRFYRLASRNSTRVTPCYPRKVIFLSSRPECLGRTVSASARRYSTTSGDAPFSIPLRRWPGWRLLSHRTSQDCPDALRRGPALMEPSIPESARDRSRAIGIKVGKGISLSNGDALLREYVTRYSRTDLKDGIMRAGSD